jgi:putative transcriptional regulator
LKRWSRVIGRIAAAQQIERPAVARHEPSRQPGRLRRPGVLVIAASASDTGLMSTLETLKNQFLIAMPGLEDENFNHTVSLLCEHNDAGAIGLVINKPTELTLRDMMAQMDLEHDALSEDAIVYWGGPVQPERGFVIHRQPGGWESSLEIEDDLYITTSRDILRSIGKGTGPEHYFVVLGYAGWGAGQLESEILHNAWLNTPLSSKVLFQIPVRDRWQEATRLLGIDVTQIAGNAGHA